MAFRTCTNCILDCAVLKKSGVSSSGIYSIDPDGKGSMNVSCDMITDGGGWTVIQRRIDNSTDFYLDWASYKNGFGLLVSNLWLGNDNIHRLTASGNTVLRVDLEDWSGNTAYAEYGKFVVDDETNKYKLIVTDYNSSSTASYGLGKEDGEFFSTKDRKNLRSQWLSFNPAKRFTGGWWYGIDVFANLNGRYLGNKTGKNGVTWYFWKWKYLSMKRAEMKLRPHSFG